jgi:hypothetical protein
MMPKLTFGDSGASDAVWAPSQPDGRPVARSPRAEVFVETDRNFRRDRKDESFMVIFWYFCF